VRSQSVGRPALLDQAARWLQLLVDRGRRSDGLLQSAQIWEAQYAAGRWDFLAQLSELSRFSILAGYIWHLKPGGAVLDVGCGQGVLLRRLASSSYSRYVGIDVSGSAVSVAQEQQNERSTFLAADCEDYFPAEQFDVIVFN
jgi:2-polyprenyl-3-methyl-5-hydroxy-6-metoxy-1,4-benzoquinol methylase